MPLHLCVPLYITITYDLVLLAGFKSALKTRLYLQYFWSRDFIVPESLCVPSSVGDFPVLTLKSRQHGGSNSASGESTVHAFMTAASADSTGDRCLSTWRLNLLKRTLLRWRSHSARPITFKHRYTNPFRSRLTKMKASKQNTGKYWQNICSGWKKCHNIRYEITYVLCIQKATTGYANKIRNLQK